MPKEDNAREMARRQNRAGVEAKEKE